MPVTTLAINRVRISMQLLAISGITPHANSELSFLVTEEFMLHIQHCVKH